MQETIGLIGGTGDLGRALAVHLSKKYNLLLGSRSRDRAIEVVDSIRKEKEGRGHLRDNLSGVDNSDAVGLSDVAILTVPYESALDTVKGLSSSFKQNQILVSAAAAVCKTGNEFHADLGESGSLSVTLKQILPPGVHMATAFQTVPANILYREKPILSDVLVAADSEECYQFVAKIVGSIEGLRPLFLGSLGLSGEIERLTALLLNLGIRNRLKSPTLKINSF